MSDDKDLERLEVKLATCVARDIRMFEERAANYALLAKAFTSVPELERSFARAAELLAETAKALSPPEDGE